jgi:hypothetical protein
VAGGQDRQGRVLVAGGSDLSGERDTALDDELFQKVLSPQVDGFLLTGSGAERPDRKPD